ncbi:hypothetical protein GOBAR_AA17808 [Gossypium barbadense]|uniref:Uncharacterized protein n=1 Tax=Gossypium barbadense TaxID=3634 RepID=A0A2P5XHT3_GOSBA|nr:hypothetical protein GOBAR_AA17808 [Gossypium barbadense]
MSSSCGKKTVVPISKKRKGAVSSSGPTAEIGHSFLKFPLGPQEELFQTLRARPLGIVEPTYLEFTLELCSTFHLQAVMTNFDYPGMIQFCLGGLVRQLSVPEFGIALGLSTEEFIHDNELDTLHRYIHYSPSKCWRDLVPASATYDLSHSKASALPPSVSDVAPTLLSHHPSIVQICQQFHLSSPTPPRDPSGDDDV